MEPGRFAPDPSLTTIQFGTAPNGTKLHVTYVNTAEKLQATPVLVITFKVDSSIWLKHNLLKLYAINRPKFSQNLTLIYYDDHETDVLWISIN